MFNWRVRLDDLRLKRSAPRHESWTRSQKPHPLLSQSYPSSFGNVWKLIFKSQNWFLLDHCGGVGWELPLETTVIGSFGHLFLEKHFFEFQTMIPSAKFHHLLVGISNALELPIEDLEISSSESDSSSSQCSWSNYHFHHHLRIITRSLRGSSLIITSSTLTKLIPTIQLDSTSPLPGFKVEIQTTKGENSTKTFPSSQWKRSWSRTTLWGMAVDWGRALQEKLLESDLGKFQHDQTVEVLQTQSPRKEVKKRDLTAGNHPKDSQRVCSKWWLFEKGTVHSWPQLLRVIFLKDCTTRNTSEHSKSTPMSFPIHSYPLVDGWHDTQYVLMMLVKIVFCLCLPGISC